MGNDPRRQFRSLIAQARSAVDPAKRTELIHEAQTLEYDEGGYVISSSPTTSAPTSAKLTGIPAGVQATFLLAPAFKEIGFTA